MALTLTANSGSTDLYEDFEAGAYLLELRSMKVTESQKFTDKDGNPKQQIECQFVLPEVEHPVEGGPLEVRTWLGASLLPPDPNARSEAGRKGSYLWKLVQVISGHACQQGEEFDLETLFGGRCKAYLSLNDRGYPRIHNDTFAPATKAKAAPSSPAPAAAAPARPAPPKAPPARPDGPTMITPDQMALIREAWAHGVERGEFGGTLEDYLARDWGGRALVEIRADEYAELAGLVGAAPF